MVLEGLKLSLIAAALLCGICSPIIYNKIRTDMAAKIEEDKWNKLYVENDSKEVETEDDSEEQTDDAQEDVNDSDDAT